MASKLFRTLAGAALLATLAAGCGDDDEGIGPIGPIDVDIDVDDQDEVEGSGTIVVESRPVADFTDVVLRGEGRVIVTQGNEESLTIETDDNLLPLIESRVENSRLEIRTTDGVDIGPTDSVTYRVGVVELSGLELLGAGSIEIGRWSAESAGIALGGAGDIRVDGLEGTTLSVDHSGAGSVAVAGMVENQRLEFSGVGEYAAADLQSGMATVDNSGTGEVTVWVTDDLEIDASGTGSVAYYGDPQVSEQVDGLATVEALGDR